MLKNLLSKTGKREALRDGRGGGVLQKWTRVPFPIDSDRVRKLSRSLTFSCEKAKRVFGYEAVETLEEGIRREVDWIHRLRRLAQIRKREWGS